MPATKSRSTSKPKPKPIKAKKVANENLAKHETPTPEPAKKGGRPPGPLRTYHWIEPVVVRPFSRKNSLNPQPGIGTVHYRADAEGAVALQTLNMLIERKDDKLVRFLKNAAKTL